MRVSWFSAGVDSFIATYLLRDSLREDGKIIYIHVDDQHGDTMRFIKDCEDALGMPIEILQSPYKSVDNVQRQFGFIKSAYGAKCTSILKKRVRKEWEAKHKGEDITYVWGFDATEKHRAERMVESYPEFEHEFPLIDRHITKQESHGMLAELGIKRPKMYDLGFHNNNCIGCPKGGQWYWNMVRTHFPEIFELRAQRERMIGHSCLRETVVVDGKKVTKQLFLDELEPGRGREVDEISQDCNIFCQLNLT